MLNDYYSSPSEITPLTMAVLAQQDDSGNISTCVLESEAEYVVDHSPSKLIHNACVFFGSSLKGKLEGTRNIRSEERRVGKERRSLDGERVGTQDQKGR